MTLPARDRKVPATALDKTRKPSRSQPFIDGATGLTGQALRIDL